MTTLPDRIPLGMVKRDFRDGVSTADRVRSVQDLPSRLLLGQLDEASFATTEDGWRARYRGEATEIDLTWGRNGLAARQRWHGHEAITDIGDGTLAKLVQAGFCHLQWLRDLPTVLAPALNVFVETGAGGPPLACYYPDGLMLVEQLVFFDDARTRRVVYPGPIRGIEQELPPVDQAASSAVRQIEDVQTLGCNRWFGLKLLPDPESQLQGRKSPRR